MQANNLTTRLKVGQRLNEVWTYGGLASKGDGVVAAPTMAQRKRAPATTPRMPRVHGHPSVAPDGSRIDVSGLSG